MILGLEAASMQVQERGVRCGLYIRYAWPRKFYILDDLNWSSVWAGQDDYMARYGIS